MSGRDTTPNFETHWRQPFSAKLEQRPSGLIGRFLNNFVSKPQEAPESSQVQDDLEAGAQAQAELQFVLEELRKAQDKCKELEEQVYALHAAQAKCRELEESAQRAQDDFQRFVAERQTELADLMRKNSEQANYIASADGEIHSLRQKHEDTLKHYEARVENLAREKGSYRSQLKQLRASTDSCPPPKTGPISLDPFDNKLDQVSEAMIKSSVESLNDSVDTFTMTLVDEAEEVAKQNSYSSLPCAFQEADGNNRLMVALQEHSHVEESRGFLLDATLHSSLVSELDNLFFSGGVVSRAVDSHGLFALALRELTMRGMCVPCLIAQFLFFLAR